MRKFTTKQGVLFYSYTFDVKELGKINKFLSLLEESGVAEIIKGYVTDSTTGRTPIRHIEDACRSNLRLCTGFWDTQGS